MVFGDMAEKTTPEMLEEIASRSVELLHARVMKGPDAMRNETVYHLVKDTGEALKILAEGIEAYKNATKKPRPLIV
jgi:hypothetical protein